MFLDEFFLSNLDESAPNRSHVGPTSGSTFMVSCLFEEIGGFRGPFFRKLECLGGVEGPATRSGLAEEHWTPSHSPEDVRVWLVSWV